MILPVLLMATTAPFSLQAPRPSAASFAFSHQAVDCVVADKHPRFEAQLPPEADVATARVFFQGASQEWYSVPMKTEGSIFFGLLPAPKRSLKEFHYYIEVTSRSLETSRTADRSTRVVASPGECRGIVAASAVSSASILVQGPAGAAAVPSGFAPAGLVAAGGGISGTTLALAGVAVGGGALAATQLAGGDDSSQYAGPVSGELTLVFGACVRVERYTFVLTIELADPTSGVAGHESGKSEVLSANGGCVTGPQTGQVDIFGIPQTPVTRSGSTVSFSFHETNALSDTQMDFKGSLSGDVISGTVTMIRRVPNATGTSVSTPMVAPVTLALRK